MATEHSAHITGRLAPSPTGYLHLGNAWAFLLAWLAARQAGGRIILRMEDIDPDRSRAHFAAAIMEDLHWLGLDWDAGPPEAKPNPLAANSTAKLPQAVSYIQSARGDYYAKALQELTAKGHVYPCYCTRKELRSLAAAPHVGDTGAPYPGTCRQLSPAQCAAHEATGRRPALRLRCPVSALADGSMSAPGPANSLSLTRYPAAPAAPAGAEEAGLISFIDAIQGPQHISLADCGGDFALRRSDGVIAYQLAVVVDDALMGITQVVRGDDILLSTPRQIFLCRLLGFPLPHYAHVPLLLDAEGQRLAKRHHSLSLHALREAGVSPRAIVGMLASLAGLLPTCIPTHPQELVPLFAFHKVPRTAQSISAQSLTVLRSSSI